MTINTFNVDKLLNAFSLRLGLVIISSQIVLSKMCIMKKLFLIVACAFGLTSIAGTKNLGTEDVSFEVIQNHDKVDIKWVSKTNCSKAVYVVERSKDGKTFEEVSRAECASATGNYMEYFDTDYTPAEGISYYRLKQVNEANEEVVYSSATIHYVKAEEILVSDIAVSQNPSGTQELNLLLKGFEGKEVLVVLQDKKGNQFFSKVFMNAMPQYIAALDPEQKIPHGDYIVTATANNKLYSKAVRVR